MMITRSQLFLILLEKLRDCWKHEHMVCYFFFSYQKIKSPDDEPKVNKLCLKKKMDQR
ncbi:hypothetical protein HanXRQr2_Chr10g0428181 [Helianthus annuus]|uniref:Uncharacterized protein n=1 Tax=Helianthus annuus TaxID=4232 RepID=A0A251TH17_HELAN|nr:hypothetical protein HanXRQr2_Chr10g0428181 [Helianthus annuus]KAJ0512964.1 hypothetical protein HanHA300_Chr10g0352061 [Helianthus annuus]KAJ0529084.1 hypothetical protein HanHA89_Chr10g0373711 [Helianthus annuus]